MDDAYIFAFYPDNQDRYKRVISLADDIKNIQQQIAENKVDLVLAEINDLSIQIMLQDGVVSVNQIQEKVLDNLSPELKQLYSLILQHIKGKSPAVDGIINSFLVVSSLSSSAPNVSTILVFGAMVAVINLVATGLNLILQGATAEGTDYINIGVEVGKMLTASSEIGPEASKFVATFQNSPRVFEAVSRDLYKIYDTMSDIGKKKGFDQHRALFQIALALLARRLQLKSLERHLFVAGICLDSVRQILTTQKDMEPGPNKDKEISSMTTGLIRTFKEGLYFITDEAVYYQLINDQDIPSGASIKDDPSFNQVLEYIAQSS